MRALTEEDFVKDVQSRFDEWLLGYINGEIKPGTRRCRSTKTVHLTQVKGHISNVLNDKYQNIFDRGASLSDKVKDIVHTCLSDAGYAKRDRFGLYDLSPDSVLNRLDHKTFY